MGNLADKHIKNYYIILIVQNNGDNLKKEYNDIICAKESLGNLIRINVTEIFSEDASPMLNGGISTMVFPSLIERACNEISEFKNNEFCGAGLWFLDSASHLRNSRPELNGVLGRIHTLLYAGINAHLGSSSSLNFLKKNEDFHLNQLLTSANNFNLFDPNSTKKLLINRIKSKQEEFNNAIEVTGSHVVRMTLSDELESDIIKSVKYI